MKLILIDPKCSPFSSKKKRKWRAMDDDSDKSDADGGLSGKLDESSELIQREPSPELARISALITRPPKQKSSNKRKTASAQTSTSLKTHCFNQSAEQSVDFSSPIRNEYFDAAAVAAPIRSDYHSSMASSTPIPPTPSGRGRPKGSSSLKGSKSKSSKASVTFSTNEPDKKSTSFDNQSAIVEPPVNVLHTVDEQVILHSVPIHKTHLQLLCATKTALSIIVWVFVDKRRESSMDLSSMRSR